MAKIVIVATIILTIIANGAFAQGDADRAKKLAEQLVRTSEKLIKAEREVLGLAKLAVVDSTNADQIEDWKRGVVGNLFRDAVYLLRLSIVYDSTNVKAFFLLGECYYRLGPGLDGAFDPEDLKSAKTNYQRSGELLARKGKLTNEEAVMRNRIITVLREIEIHLQE